MIETKDLLLRPGRAEDAEALYRNLWSRPEAFRCLFSSPSPDRAAGERRTALYAAMHREVETEFFICERTSGEVIGIAGVKELAPGHWTVTDIAIGPDFWGRGYGRQVLTALETLVRSRGGAELDYCCFADNAASKALALSRGFHYVHSAEGELKKNGAPVLLEHYCKTLGEQI